MMRGLLKASGAMVCLVLAAQPTLIAGVPPAAATTAPGDNILKSILAAKNLKLSAEPKSVPSQFTVTVGIPSLKMGDKQSNYMVFVAARDGDRLALVFYSKDLMAPVAYVTRDLAVFMSTKEPGKLIVLQGQPSFVFSGDIENKSGKFKAGIGTEALFDVDMETFFKAMQSKIQLTVDHPNEAMLDVRTEHTRVRVDYDLRGEAPFPVSRVLTGPNDETGEVICGLNIKIGAAPAGLFAPTRADVLKLSVEIREIPEINEVTEKELLEEMDGLCLGNFKADVAMTKVARALSTLFPEQLFVAATQAGR